MKKKVLSALLAVALFVGLAVPAFASTESTQAGDPSKVTKIEFADSSYELKQDVEKDFDGEVKVYETNKKLVLDHNQLSWSLEGGSTAFTITGSKVTAIEKTGTATLVVKDDESGKVIAKTKLTAVANPKEKFATSYKFASTNNKIPFAASTNANSTKTSNDAAEDYTFKVYPIPAGTSWGVNENDVKTEVIGKVNTALGLTASAGTPAVAAVYSIDLTGMTSGTITEAFGITGLSVNFDTDAATTAAALKAALSKAGYTFAVVGSKVTMTADVAGIDAGATAIKAGSVVGAVGISSATVTEDVAGADAGAGSGVEFVKVDGDDSNAMVFKVNKTDLATTAKELNKQIAVNTTVAFTNQEGKAQKSVNAKTIFTPVLTKEYKTIAVLSNKTIEVGGTFSVADTVKKGATDSNVNGGVSYSERALDTSDVEDYAIVNSDGKVTGVAVGTNYIVATLDNGNGEAVCKVTVVEKGTLPAETSDMKLSSTTATLVVGGTSYITVANAPEDGIEWSIDNDNATIVAAKGAVKIFAKKVGTATVTCTVNGVELGKIAVTVKAADTTEPTKPGATTNPQTGDSIFAGLF